MDLPPATGLMALLHAARLGSLTAAADELGLTHGAISRRIKALEEWLGSSVFERHGRGVRLTADGALLAKRAERSMAAISAMARDIKSGRPQAPVKVSVLPSFARLWLIPNLREIEQAEPALHLRLHTEHALAALDGREADVAVRSGYGDWSGVSAIKIFGERLYPIAAPDIAAKIDGGDARLFDFPLLHDSDSSGWKRWARDAGQVYVAKNSDRRFDDYDLVLAAARAGLGIALARMPLASLVLRDGRLARLAAPAVEIGMAHWAVVRLAEDRPTVLNAQQRIVALGTPFR